MGPQHFGLGLLYNIEEQGTLKSAYRLCLVRFWKGLLIVSASFQIRSFEQNTEYQGSLKTVCRLVNDVFCSFQSNSRVSIFY